MGDNLRITKGSEHDIAKDIARPVRDNDESQKWLFDVDPWWKKHWWGMPEFVMGDATPAYQVMISFMTKEDLIDFEKLTGIKTRTDVSVWYPPVIRSNRLEWAYVSE